MGLTRLALRLSRGSAATAGTPLRAGPAGPEAGSDVAVSAGHHLWDVSTAGLEMAGGLATPTEKVMMDQSW